MDVIVASGGFFTVGKDSFFFVVPLNSLKVSQDRASFYLSITSEAVKTVPVMPDQEYRWLADANWRNRNDALFKVGRCRCSPAAMMFSCRDFSGTSMWQPTLWARTRVWLRLQVAPAVLAQ